MAQQYRYSPHASSASDIQPDFSIRTLNKGYTTICAALRIIPPNNDYSLIRHMEAEQIVIDRMLAKAAEHQNEYISSSGIRTTKPKRPMNAVMAYAQRRRPMISRYYPNLLTAGVSRILGYEWSTLISYEEKKYWTDLQTKVGKAFKERYRDYDYGSKRMIQKGTDIPSRVVSTSRPKPSPPLVDDNLGIVHSGPHHFAPAHASISPTVRHDLRPLQSSPCPKPENHLLTTSPLSFAQTKHQKSAPRMIYAQNPPRFSRNPTGSYTSLQPTASPSAAHFPLDRPSLPISLGCRTSPGLRTTALDTSLPLPALTPLVTVTDSEYTFLCPSTIQRAPQHIFDPYPVLPDHLDINQEDPGGPYSHAVSHAVITLSSSLMTDNTLDDQSAPVWIDNNFTFAWPATSPVYPLWIPTHPVYPTNYVDWTQPQPVSYDYTHPSSTTHHYPGPSSG